MKGSCLCFLPSLTTKSLLSNRELIILQSLSLLFIFFSVQAVGFAQRNIVIDTSTYTVEELVRDVLIQSDCAEIENVNFIGMPGQVGYFSNGTNAIQMDKGIILSTGRVHDAVGPNSSTGTATEFVDVAHVGDDDLRQVAGVSVNKLKDEAIIEFDFIPLDDVMEFEFVFASEEYCEYAGITSTFNDVFGFFLSGPGIAGPYSNNSTNLALSPGTNDNITVKNINQDLNYDFFIDNTPYNQPQVLAEHVTNCRLAVPRDGISSLLDQDGQSVSSLEYDGYTVTLKATSAVVPFQRYHLRIGVGDVDDGTWDSAVFLKAGSFKSGQPQALIELPDTLDCVTHSTVIDASNSSRGKKYSYSWTTLDGNIVSGSTGYTPRVDQDGRYQLIVSRVGSACADTAYIDIIFNDSAPEILNATSGTLTCSDQLVDILIEINDPASFTYQVAYPSGTFSDIKNDTRFSTSHAGWHRLLAYSSNGCQDEYMHFVDIDTFAGVVVFDTYIITCRDQQVNVVPQFTDLGFPFTYHWQTTDGNIISSPDSIEVLIDEAGDYMFIATNLLNGCSRTFTTNIVSDVELPMLYAGDDQQLNCIDAFVVPNASINAADGDEVILWISLDGGAILNGANGLAPEIISSGRYVLLVEKNNGCFASDTVLIAPAEDAPEINLVHVDSLTCDVESGIIDITITGGYETVSWSTNVGTIETVSANSQSVLFNGVGQYTVLVSNSSGCTSVLIIDVIKSALPLALAGMDRTLACDGQAILEAGNIDSDVDITYTWTGGPDPGILIEQSTAIVNAPGLYVLTVRNQRTACESTDEIEIIPSPNEINYQLEFSNCEFSQGTFFIEPDDVSNVSSIFYGSQNYDATANIQVGAFDELTIVKSDGCDQLVNLDYILNSSLTVTFEALEKVVAGEPFKLTAQINRRSAELLSIEWIADVELPCKTCLQQSLNINKPINVRLVVEDIYGCREEITISIRPEVVSNVYVPNAFSPNDDGINDKLELFSNEFIAAIESMKIFDRWGNRIFSLSNNAESSIPTDSFAWDGMVDNNTKQAPAGVYVYSAAFRTTADVVINVSGSFVLVR